MSENRMFCYQCEQTACGSGCTMGDVDADLVALAAGKH